MVYCNEIYKVEEQNAILNKLDKFFYPQIKLTWVQNKLEIHYFHNINCKVMGRNGNTGYSPSFINLSIHVILCYFLIVKIEILWCRGNNYYKF